MRPSLVLFDLDRTLVRRDTAGLYIRYEWDEGLVPFDRVAQVAWWRLRYTLGWLSAVDVAARVLLWNKGRSAAELEEHGRVFFERVAKAMVPQSARDAVQQRLDEGAVVAIATASTRFIAQPFAAELGIENLLCSEVEVADGHLTGRVIEPLCYGAGKLLRVQAFADSLGISLDDAAFYSDSITDLPTLEAVGLPIATNPDPRLLHFASRRGWQVTQFR